MTRPSAAQFVSTFESVGKFFLGAWAIYYYELVNYDPNRPHCLGFRGVVKRFRKTKLSGGPFSAGSHRSLVADLLGTGAHRPAGGAGGAGYDQPGTRVPQGP